MRVLLTNDDGVEAEGLRAIRAELIRAGAQVTTVAPSTNQSGFARACTFSRPVSVRRASGGVNPVFSCAGTPTDCVRVGLLGGLAVSADLVVSGINHGANLADDIIYSGTIGAGLEASVLGLPALCLSQQTPTGSFSVNYTEKLEELGLSYDFRVAASHGAAVAAALVAIGADEPMVLSVNYPTTPDPARARLTRPGLRAYPKASDSDWAEGETERELYLFGEPDEPIPAPDGGTSTDIGALQGGEISVTLLSSVIGIEQLVDSAAVQLRNLGASLTSRHGWSLSGLEAMQP